MLDFILIALDSRNLHIYSQSTLLVGNSAILVTMQLDLFFSLGLFMCVPNLTHTATGGAPMESVLQRSEE